jgi:hypothetical protein
MKVFLGCLISNPYFIKYMVEQNPLPNKPDSWKIRVREGSVQLEPSLYTDFREFLNILCIHAKYWLNAILISPPFLLLYEATFSAWTSRLPEYYVPATMRAAPPKNEHLEHPSADSL